MESVTKCVMKSQVKWGQHKNITQSNAQPKA